MALVFNHDSMHEGEAVIKGTKYIARSEIMFQRVDSHCVGDRDGYLKKENYFKGLYLNAPLPGHNTPKLQLVSRLSEVS